MDGFSVRAVGFGRCERVEEAAVLLVCGGGVYIYICVCVTFESSRYRSRNTYALNESMSVSGSKQIVASYQLT